MTAKTLDHQPPRRPTSRLVATLALLFTLLAGACSSGFDRADSSVSAASDAYSGQDAEAPAQAVQNETVFTEAEARSDAATDLETRGDFAALTVTGSAGNQEAVAQLPDIGRDIIYTASLELASTDVSRATREAIQTIERRGGFLFSQETQGGAYGSSVLTFKVLPDQFHAALNDLGSVGTVRSQSISADDVSAIVVDLESRINTAEASVARLRNLLDDATELDTIATLENQLLQRETTLEQLRGQLRSVQNQVDLATITVFVTELTNRPGLHLEAASYAGHDAGFGCFDTASSRSGEVGDATTICYRLTNTGDTPLTDLALADASLGATLESLIVVDGSTTELSVGESVVVAQEFELTEPVRVRTTATAIGIDADGNKIDAPVKATAPTMRFDVTNYEDDFPSFGEVLGNSWNAIKTIAIVLALFAVAVAPFVLIALAIGWPLRLWFRNYQANRPANPAPPAPPAPSTPLGPTTTGDAAETVGAATTA